MQTVPATPQAPPAPAAPAAPAAPSAGPTRVVVVGASSSVPMTQADVAALRARREELSNQLQSVASRRKSVADRLRTADGADRVGLEQRLRVLDQRIVQLESDIAETGQQLTSAPAGLVASTAVPSDFPGGLSSGQVTGISIVFMHEA